MGSQASKFFSMGAAAEATEWEKKQKLCAETAAFQKEFYQKLKDGWKSIEPFEDMMIVHYLYRIFFVAPSSKDVQKFEWINFFDTHHDIPMRVHNNDDKGEDHCATMLDIMRWYQKPDGEKCALRSIGQVPKLVFCLDCKDEDEKDFKKLFAAEQAHEESKGGPSVHPVSVKAAKRLGMSVLDTADLAVTSNKTHSLLTIANIGFPLRRSASVLLYPLTEGLEVQFKLEREGCIFELNEYKIERSHSNMELQSPEVAEKDLIGKEKCWVTFSKLGIDCAKYGWFLKPHEWVRLSEESMKKKIRSKIHQRLLMIDNYIAGWENIEKLCSDVDFVKWLHDDLHSPLHTRQFANFAYFHLIPSNATTECRKKFSEERNISVRSPDIFL